jgi:hypothetical protein
VPNKDEDLFAEFQEFLTAKKEAEAQENAEEDFDVEIWGPDGSGVRTRRSHAKPLLQKLGLDVDPPTDPPDNDGGKPKGKKINPAPTAATTSTARKYFQGKPK